MALIRVAKGLGGDASAIIDMPLAEAPWDLVSAVNQSLIVLSWYENLPKDEQPPRWIWWSEELLDEWFKNVVKNRKKGTKPEEDDVPMSQNEYAKRPVFVDG